MMRCPRLRRAVVVTDVIANLPCSHDVFPERDQKSARFIPKFFSRVRSSIILQITSSTDSLRRWPPHQGGFPVFALHVVTVGRVATESGRRETSRYLVPACYCHACRIDSNTGAGRTNGGPEWEFAPH